LRVDRRAIAALAAASALLGVTMTLNMARAATNPATTVAASCDTPYGAQNQDVQFRATGPDSAEAGSTVTLKLEQNSPTLPSSASGIAVNSYKDMETIVDIHGATVTAAQISKPGANLGAGTPTATVSGNTVSLKVPGPIPGGTTITTPEVTITVTATATAGATLGLKPSSPFYKVTASTSAVGDVQATCTATNPAQGTLTVAVGGPDTAGPSVSISAPYDGAIYGFGQVVKANYACSDPSGVASCNGNVAKGADIDTATEGGKTFTVSATDSKGNASTKTVNYLVLPPGVAPPAGPAYTPLNPGRILDTRTGGSTVDGTSAGTGAITPGQVVTLQVAGRAGVPDDAGAAILNVTATATAGWGYVTVYPCDEARPTASNLNYTEAQDTRPNAVVTKIAADGTVCLVADQAGTDLIVDVSGYFPAGAMYTPLNPGRILDTRTGGSTVDGTSVGGGATSSGQTLVLPVADRHGVPADAGSVALNVTATATKGWGYVTVYPCTEPRPTASTINYTGAGQTTPNAVITKLGADGTVCLFTDQAGADLIVDVDGYFPAGADFRALNPARLLDTRTGGSTTDGSDVGAGRPAPGQSVELQVAGRGDVPADAIGAVLNVTATDTIGWGYVTVWPCDAARPTASNLNHTAAGQTRPNAVVTKLSATGTVCLYADPATAHLLVDVDGYFPKASGPVVPPFEPPATPPTTTPTTPPTTQPGDTTPPTTAPPEDPPACANYASRTLAQAAYAILQVLAPTAAAALDPNGNGVVCEGHTFLLP
jgi:hypothetical protein